MTEVDAERFGRLLLKVEDRADRAGWDREPLLMVIYDTTDTETHELYRSVMAANPTLGPPLRLGHYAAQPWMPGSWLMSAGDEVWGGLWTFAVNLAWGQDHKEAATIASCLSQPAGVLGVAFIGEAWGTTGRQDFVRLVLGEFAHADQIAGAREARIVYARDVTGRPYRVERVRGELPELITDGVWSGDFTRSLALLVDVINDAVVPYEEHMRRYPLLRDVALGTAGDR
jgi:hypothetical protein